MYPVTANELTHAVAGTRLHDFALYLLSNVPGFPPIVQTIHLLGIAAIMGSAVLLDLKILGLALPGQERRDLTRRLMPWTWGALPLVAISGLVFVFAQPHRYFDNPMFRLKFMLLVPAILVTIGVHRPRLAEGAPAKILAALSLGLWLGVVMAGRWIAYVDYLWPAE